MTPSESMQSSILVKDSLAEQLNFLQVPAGTATLGIDDKLADKFISAYGEIWAEYFKRETPQHQVQVESFALARYPVTNGLYAQFMAADGYNNADYWTPDGWSWRLVTNRTQPLMWSNPKFAGDNRPVVGISWFEAMALAHWASVQSGLSVRLPTEAEWEWAARGTNTRSLYPWGGAWDLSRLNSGAGDENHPWLGTTAPVGTYSPAGDGPFGHAELLGQVWEWSSSLFRTYPYKRDDGREDLYAPERRVVRGGNWSDGKYVNRASTRYPYPAYYSDFTTGVRLAAGGTQPGIAQRPKYDLVLYGKSIFCSDVVKVKQWLHAWNVSYRQLDFDLDERVARRLDEWLGTRTTPTLVVAERNSVEPLTPPADADFSNLRDKDRGSMLHEPEEATLRAFLVRHGFLAG